MVDSVEKQCIEYKHEPRYGGFSNNEIYNNNPSDHPRNQKAMYTRCIHRLKRTENKRIIRSP